MIFVGSKFAKTHPRASVILKFVSRAGIPDPRCQGEVKGRCIGDMDGGRIDEGWMGSDWREKEVERVGEQMEERVCETADG